MGSSREEMDAVKKPDHRMGRVAGGWNTAQGAKVDTRVEVS
jgi:hypothetical protein